jgi:hypothetical protein
MKQAFDEVQNWSQTDPEVGKRFMAFHASEREPRGTLAAASFVTVGEEQVAVPLPMAKQSSKPYKSTTCYRQGGSKKAKRGG